MAEHPVVDASVLIGLSKSKQWALFSFDAVDETCEVNGAVTVADTEQAPVALGYTGSDLVAVRESGGMS